MINYVIGIGVAVLVIVILVRGIKRRSSGKGGCCGSWSSCSSCSDSSCDCGTSSHSSCKEDCREEDCGCVEGKSH